MKSAFKSEVAA